MVHPTHLSRRDVLSLAGAGAGLTLLGARTRVAAAQASPGGILRIGAPADLVRPDPNVLGAASGLLIPQVFSALVRYDATFQPQPELAERWTWNADFTQLTIGLRQGVQFHDGKAFTSEDVRYTIERVRDPELGAFQLKTFSDTITDIQTPDATTVVLGFARPQPAILDFLSLLFIADQATVEGPDAAQRANGTGPFLFSEWLPGERYRLAKNTSFWKPDRPYLDEVEVQVIKDQQALLVQLETSTLDMIENVAEREAARLQGDSNFRVALDDVSGSSFYIAANTTKPPLDNKLVRQALNYAIDRNRFVQSTLAGIGEATAIPWPPHSAAFDAAKRDAYAFDLDKAQALLQEAGVSTLELQLVTNGGQAPLGAQAQIYQADLAKIGVTLNVQNLEVPQWREQFSAGSYEGLISGPFASANMEPSSLFVLARPYNYQGNASNFQSEQYTELVETSLTEPDAAVRAELYGQITDFLLDESFVMPMARILTPRVIRAGVHGVVIGVNIGTVLENASVED